jgi:hypothetical protein
MADIVASKALVTTKKECPLCASKSRQYIDTVILEMREAEKPVANEDDFDAPPIQVVHDETANYKRIEATIRDVLAKLNDSTEFGYADLLVHAGEHTMVSQLAGLKVRSEGNYLIVGEEVYQKIDPKDALAFGIAYGVQSLQEGRMKLTAPAWTNMMALLWRMMGNSGTDDFVQAMLTKVQSGELNTDSPLGAAFVERQQKLANQKIKNANSQESDDEHAHPSD